MPDRAEIDTDHFPCEGVAVTPVLQNDKISWLHNFARFLIFLLRRMCCGNAMRAVVNAAIFYQTAALVADDPAPLAREKPSADGGGAAPLPRAIDGTRDHHHTLPQVPGSSPCSASRS